MIILAEFNFYWQNITSTGRIWLPLAEHGLYWLIVTLLLVEFDLYWQNMTSIGRIWFILAYFTLTGRICSQSKVFCRSALLCRFNIPFLTPSYFVKEPSVISGIGFLLAGGNSFPLHPRTHVVNTKHRTHCLASFCLHRQPQSWRVAPSVLPPTPAYRERKCAENYNK